MKRLSGAFALLGLATLAGSWAPAQEAPASADTQAAQPAKPDDNAQALNQLVADLQKNPGDSGLREKIIKLAANMNPAPAIPDEADRHSARAAAFAKMAKSNADYDLTIAEYQQALQIAPWWGAAYYKLAVVLEATERFDEAANNLKLFLLTNPSKKNAGEAKERLYSIEAEKELAGKRHAAEQAAADAQRADEQWTRLSVYFVEQNKANALKGPWACSERCDSANLTVTDAGFSGTIRFSWQPGKSGGWTETYNGVTDSVGIVVQVMGQFKGTTIVHGAVVWPILNLLACSSPGETQALTGTISEDRRTMDFNMVMSNWIMTTQPGLLVSTCLSVTTQGTVPLNASVQSNAQNIPPLIMAVQSGQIENVKLALAHRSDVNATGDNGFTALHLAGYANNVELAQLVLDHGANIQANQTIGGVTPLQAAVAVGGMNVAQLLLDRGANYEFPAGNGWTPLFFAAYYGQLNTANLLLAKGARIEAKATDGSTPLFWAIDQVKPDAVKLLLDAHANVNAKQNDGGTPLHVAATKGNTEITEMLLQHGALVNEPDRNGITPLHNAAKTGNFEMVELLVQSGTNINAKDNKGHSVLKYAKDAHVVDSPSRFNPARKTVNKDLVKYLQSQGAK